MIHAHKAIQEVVTQIEAVLVQIEAQDFRRPLPEFDGSTLGQHFRHILEFFQCLEQGAKQGMVDYAARERNLLYEDNPALAAAALSDFTASMNVLSDDLVLSVKAEFGGEERPAYQSTLGRELLFVYDHAIHHLAIIKIGIRCRFPHLQIDKNLGVSPSTIKAWEMRS